MADDAARRRYYVGLYKEKLEKMENRIRELQKELREKCRELSETWRRLHDLERSREAFKEELDHHKAKLEE